MKNLRHLLIEDNPDDRALALRELKKEKEYYYNFVRSLNDWAWEMDVNGIHTYSNPAVESILGYKVDDVVGQHITTLWLDEAKTRKNLKWLKKTLAEGKGWKKFQGRFKHKNGSTVITESTVIPIFDSKNKLIGYRGVDRDITEYKRSVDALRKSEEKYRTVFENTGTAMAIIEEDTTISLVNKGFVNLSGFSRKELEGKKSWTEFVVKEDLVRMKKQHSLRRKDSEAVLKNYEFRFVDKKGNIKNIFLTIDMIPGTMKSVASLLDITDRKRVEDALQAERDTAHKYLDIAGVGIVALDVKGEVTRINKKGCKILGYKEKEIIGQNWFANFIPKTESKEVKDVFNKQMKGEIKPVEYFENSIVTKKGEERVISWNNMVLKDEAGKICGVLSSGKDITERKQAEEARYKSEEKYRRLVDNLSDVVLEADKDGNFTYASPQITDLFGFKPKEVVGKNAFEFIHPDDIENAMDAMAEGLKCEKMIRVEYRTRHKDGHYIPIFGSAKIIKEGDDFKIISVIRDITERKQSEKQLKKYREHLEELVKQRTEQLEDTNTELEAFAYSVSHDLRAPLRGMQGFAHALLEDYGDKFDDKGREYANRIIDSSVHMNTIIEDLLAYSRLSRAELGLKPVSLGKVLNEALEPLERRIREKSVKLKVEPNLPGVKAHSTTLHKVIYNLILNAITFVDEDAKPKIKVWAVKHKSKVRLYVKDNGIGIAPEYHDKIFGIFERLHGIETYPGTGIGLAIVRKGMDRMEGTYGLESELGKGSTFWIELAKEGIKNV